MNIFIPDEAASIKDDLRRFFDAMIYKLRKNRHKGRWADLDIHSTLARLRDEVAELEEAIKEGSSMEIILESADVANFAMILANIAIERGNVRNGHSEPTDQPHVEFTKEPVNPAPYTQIIMHSQDFHDRYVGKPEYHELVLTEQGYRTPRGAYIVIDDFEAQPGAALVHMISNGSDLRQSLADVRDDVLRPDVAAAPPAAVETTSPDYDAIWRDSLLVQPRRSALRDVR